VVRCFSLLLVAGYYVIILGKSEALNQNKLKIAFMLESFFEEGRGREQLNEYLVACESDELHYRSLHIQI